MTDELMKQVRMGVIPKDEDLLHAIEWFRKLKESMLLFNGRYNVIYDDLGYTLRALESYWSARGKS